jgi:hypothetical protein
VWDEFLLEIIGATFPSMLGRQEQDEMRRRSQLGGGFFTNLMHGGVIPTLSLSPTLDGHAIVLSLTCSFEAESLNFIFEPNFHRL